MSLDSYGLSMTGTCVLFVRSCLMAVTDNKETNNKNCDQQTITEVRSSLEDLLLSIPSTEDNIVDEPQGRGRRSDQLAGLK